MLPGEPMPIPATSAGLSQRQADRRVERCNHRLEPQIFEVFLVLTLDRPVLRHDRRGNVRAAEIDADSRSHAAIFCASRRPYPQGEGIETVMETIDLINLRNFSRRTGQPTHPELLDARPLEHVNKIEIDEEHITVEFDEKISRYYNANEITRREWVYKYNDDPRVRRSDPQRHRPGAQSISRRCRKTSPVRPAAPSAAAGTSRSSAGPTSSASPITSA